MIGLPPSLIGLVVGLVAVGCGGGARNPGSVETPPAAGSTGPAADAGTSAGGGGTADAGTTAGGGSTDAGTAAGGGNIADAGTVADAGTGAGGGTGTDAGTLADECDGIVPSALGPSASATAANGTSSSSCSTATSDGEGNVAVVNDTNGNFEITLSTFSSTGAPLGQTDNVNKGLVPRSAGFEGTTFNPRGPPSSFWHFLTWAPDLSLHSARTVGNDECTPTVWPRSAGGSVVLLHCSPSGAIQTVSFDDDGTPVSTYGEGIGSVRTFGKIAAVGDSNGNTLVVGSPGSDVGFGSTDLVGRWLDSSGAPKTGWFLIKSGGSGELAAHSLIGGGAAVRQGGVWVASMASGSDSLQAAPSWLVSGYDLHTIRGRRAYALTSLSGGSTVELVAASGKRCGAIDVGGANVNIGRDGTAITQTGNRGCHVNWYPGLLK